MVQKRDHCHTHLDGLAGMAKTLFATRNRGQLEGGAQDMVVLDTGSVGVVDVDETTALARRSWRWWFRGVQRLPGVGGAGVRYKGKEHRK